MIFTYEDLISKLQNNEPFSFSRFGDGEINCILGASPGQDATQNCDKHKYFKDMGMRLYKILESKPKYIMGMQSLAMRLRKDDKDFHEVAVWDIEAALKAAYKAGQEAMVKFVKVFTNF